MITIKIGGSIVDALHPSAIQDIKNVLKEQEVVIVHGGGKEVSRICKQMGKDPKFVTSPGGMRSRYTDEDTMDIFEMVMSGRISGSIVRMLQAGGINAARVSGADGLTIRAKRKERLLIVNEKGRKQAIEGGYTGKVSQVDVSLLRAMLEIKITPVISPIALGEKFEQLNIDGDRAAANVAGALKSNHMIFVTDVDGFLDGQGRTVSSLSLEEAKAARPKTGPGMEKKLLASIEALEMGVGEAIIANGGRENPISSAILHENCTVIKR